MVEVFLAIQKNLKAVIKKVKKLQNYELINEVQRKTKQNKN